MPEAEDSGRGHSPSYSRFDLPSPITRYSLPSGAVSSAYEFPMTYNGDAFELSNTPAKPWEVWYATKETKGNIYSRLVYSVDAIVNYKGTKVVVKGIAQIYDPETKNILQFTNHFAGFPWSGPEMVDIKREMDRR